MIEEIGRAKQLIIPALQSPYYIEIAVDDAVSYTAGASLGGVFGESNSRTRLPRVQVRVGTYGLDNTNYIFTDLFARRGPGALPLDNNLGALRHWFWLAIDDSYKGSLDSLSRKRAALQNILVTDRLDDFSRVQPVTLIEPPNPVEFDRKVWLARIRSLSAEMLKFPNVAESSVDFQAGQSVAYLANSEGTRVAHPDNLSTLRVRASGVAPDGATVRDWVLVQASDPAGLPAEADLRRAALQAGENVSALLKAPVGEAYSGPVLFEGMAAAQIFGDVFGRNLAMARRPVSEPGRPVPVLESELDGRIGARVLPEWMSAVDDPTRKEWSWRPLLGHYRVDMEGVIPAPLQVVDQGTLKAVLLTRQPVRGFEMSNGRARMPGSFGAKAAGISNLFITASKTVPAAELKQRLIDLCRQRNKPYGLIVRKMDFPSTADSDEMRRISASIATGGGGRPVSVPLLLYRVYLDGREELIRGMRLRAFSVRAFRDIIAASSESYLFDYLNNTAPFALSGAVTYVAGTAVVAPAVIFEDLDLEAMQEEYPRPPLVPSPALALAR
jgi:hypothetical protein